MPRLPPVRLRPPRLQALGPRPDPPQLQRNRRVRGVSARFIEAFKVCELTPHPRVRPPCPPSRSGDLDSLLVIATCGRFAQG